MSTPVLPSAKLVLHAAPPRTLQYRRAAKFAVGRHASAADALFAPAAPSPPLLPCQIAPPTCSLSCPPRPSFSYGSHSLLPLPDCCAKLAARWPLSLALPWCCSTGLRLHLHDSLSKDHERPHHLNQQHIKKQVQSSGLTAPAMFHITYNMADRGVTTAAMVLLLLAAVCMYITSKRSTPCSMLPPPIRCGVACC